MKLLGVTRCMTCCLVFVTSTATAQLSTVSVGDSIKASDMNAIIAALNDAGVLNGNINLKASTSATGNLLKDGTRFLHNFGSSNTFLGFESGNTTMLTGSFNTGVGAHVLKLLTSGSFNTALGMNALRLNSEGSNTAVGANALFSNTTGTNNTAVGQNALLLNTADRAVSTPLRQPSSAFTVATLRW